MLFGCNICGLVDDFCNQYMYNDLTVCGKCHNLLHKRRKLQSEILARPERPKGMFEDDDD